jgi:trk system potassium uptake protein TrkA
MAIRNKILIIGSGRLGSIIADRASARGENVIVLDEKESSFKKLDEAFTGFKVHGDATDITLLEQDCYIESVSEVVIVTGDDNTNLFLAHLCAEIYNVPRVYVRFDDPDKAILISGSPNVKAIYPSDLSANKFFSIEAEGEK